MKTQRIARRTAHPLVLRGLAAVSVVLAAAGCGGGGSSANEPPVTVFGRQARELAVGVAAQRLGQTVGVTTTVLAQDGTGRENLRVALAGAHGGWVASEPCGTGRYCGELPVAGPSPQVRVRLTRPAGRVSTVSVKLPQDPEPERAAALVRASGAAVRALNSLIINEYLASGPPYDPLVTQFSYVAPDRLTYATAGAGSAVVIGGSRWDRQNAESPWEQSAQEPLQVPAPDWRRVRDASILGSATRDGRAVWRVSFFDPTVPAWFETEIDKRTDLPLRLWMTASAHFMKHSFSAFNAPLAILPPG